MSLGWEPAPAVVDKEIFPATVTTMFESATLKADGASLVTGLWL
jgi:hypothetical protein